MPIPRSCSLPYTKLRYLCMQRWKLFNIGSLVPYHLQETCFLTWQKKRINKWSSMANETWWQLLLYLSANSTMSYLGVQNMFGLLYGTPATIVFLLLAIVCVSITITRSHHVTHFLLFGLKVGCLSSSFLLDKTRGLHAWTLSNASYWTDQN